MFDLLHDKILKRLKLGAVDTSNWVFKLCFNLSPVICFLAAVLVLASSYIGDPITCIDDRKIVEATCWIHGTYHIGNDDLSRTVNHGDVCKRVYPEDATEDDKNEDTAYYQWVPFMLFIHGVIFLLPGQIWNFLEDGLMIQFAFSKVKSKRLETEELGNLAEQEATKFRALSRKRNRRYFVKFVFCEIGNVLAVILNFCLIDIFLGTSTTSFKSYGADVVRYIMRGKHENPKPANPMCSAFPTLTSCDFATGGVTGATDNTNTLCILSQNIINQKIYLALWFWFIILFISLSAAMIYRVATIALPYFRKTELVWLLKTKRGRDGLDENYMRKQWSYTGRIGNWFVLCQIGRNSDPYFFREFLSNLNTNNNDAQCSEKLLSNKNIEEG